VNVLFDNCTAPRLAATLDGYITADGHRAFHIKDLPGLPKGRNSSDIEWIELLRRDNRNWIFISGDGRILKNSAERAALRSAGLHGFILSPAYQKTMLHQVAATIVWKWPEIEGVANLLAPPSMHEIPIGRIQKIRQLSF
jgi:PIN like domain